MAFENFMQIDDSPTEKYRKSSGIFFHKHSAVKLFCEFSSITTFFTRTYVTFGYFLSQIPSVCLSSVTFVRPTQPFEIVGHVSGHFVP